LTDNGGRVARSLSRPSEITIETEARVSLSRGRGKKSPNKGGVPHKIKTQREEKKMHDRGRWLKEGWTSLQKTSNRERREKG